jgi:hypothetical protein
MFMAAAYIEHRPLASDPHAGTAHHAVVVNGREIRDFKTQREAAEWAKAQGYTPVHVARERHLQNREVPDHWRHYSSARASSENQSQPATREGVPLTTEAQDARIEPSAGEIGINSEAAVEAAQRLFGGGLKFVREAGDDELCLNVEDYANAVAQLYASADEGEFCLAVFGAWGRGKTFLMRRVDRALRASARGYRTISFSAWKYPSAPEVWVHLYEEFAKVAFEGPWYRVLPNVVRAGVTKHGTGSLLWAYALFAFGLIPLGTLFGFANTIVGALYPVIGVIGFVLLVTLITGVRHTKARLSHQYLTISRHTEKLGLQATIGSDLRALLIGWIPIRPFRGAFTLWYALITAGLVAAVMLRLAQGVELEYLAKKYLDWTIIGQARRAIEVGLVVVIIALFAGILYWLRHGGSSPRKVLLVVDDLDRCKPEHLLSVMESIKLLIEDPDISSRVQVAMLLEEDVLKHAIFEKYGHLTDEERARLLRTNYDADRLMWENGEKLFTAHLRLPLLAKSELRDLIEAFSGRRRDLAEEQRALEARRTELERERDREPITRVQTGMAPSSKASDRVLEKAEIDAILMALDTQTATRTSLGPRAIRAFIFRYQLARLLLDTLKIGWEPEILAKSLAERAFGSPVAAPAPISANLTDEQKLQRVVDQVY